MQYKNATNLELRLSECVNRCETELPASELETTIVVCLSDAANELQRLRAVVSDLSEMTEKMIEITERMNKSYPKSAPVVPWASSLYIGFSSSLLHNSFWVRWTGADGVYRWLHPTEKRWVGEPEQIEMPKFSNYASAQLAANYSPEPPTWQVFKQNVKN